MGLGPFAFFARSSFGLTLTGKRLFLEDRRLFGATHWHGGKEGCVSRLMSFGLNWTCFSPVTMAQICGLILPPINMEPERKAPGRPGSF